MASKTSPYMDEPYVCKILVVGDIGCGKTAFVKRVITNTFSQQYKSTIGVDMMQKLFNVNTSRIRLTLWDIAGQERYGNMTRVYYKEADMAIVMFDLLRLGTFENVTKWIYDLRSKLSDELIIFMVGTKTDLVDPDEEPSVSPDMIERLMSSHSIKHYYHISSKTGENVDTLMNKIALVMLEHKIKMSKENDEIADTGFHLSSDMEKDDKPCCGN